MKNRKRTVSFLRQESIMKKASKLRNYFSNCSEPCDIANILEFGKSKLPRDFDWIVGSDSDFDGMTDAEAYVTFSNGKLLVMRESVYVNLFEGEGYKKHQAKFIVAHEIGHVMLHSSATCSLPRRVVGSKNQYSNNPKLEKEANYFAGSLLVSTIKHHESLGARLDAYTIATRFDVSLSVAKACLEEIVIYQNIQELKG